MTTTIKVRDVVRYGKWILSGGLVLALSGTSTAFSGGPSFVGGFIQPFNPAMFANEPCHDVPITYVYDSSLVVEEWGFDVAAVRDDGDPNTFVRCRFLGSSAAHEVNCIAGLADGRILGCDDNRSLQSMPEDGDILYLRFASYQGEVEECEIDLSRNWGQPDPKCRVGGSGDGDGDGDGQPSFPCNSSNSTAFADNAIAPAQVDQCYSFSKAVGQLRMSTWQGQSFVVHVADSQGNVWNGVNISSGNWAAVMGVANGPVYFYLTSISSGSSIPIQLHDW